MQQVTFRHAAFIYLIGVCCFSAFLLPNAVSAYAGNAAVFAPLLGSGISLVYTYFLYRILHRYGSVQNLIASKWGNRGAKVFDFTIAAWLLCIAVFYINALYDRLASTAFGYMPRWIVLCAVVLVTALFAFSPPKTVARSGSIIFIIMLFTLLFIFAFGAKGIEVKSFLPIKYKTFTLFLRALLFPVGVCGWLTFFVCHFEVPAVRFRTLAGCQLAAGGLMSAVILFTQGVFGSAFAQKLSYPFFALIKSTDALIRPEHFESLVSGIWIVMSLGFFIALVSVIVGVWRRCMHMRTQAVKDVLCVLPHAVILAAALLIPENRFFNEFVLGTVMPAGNIVLGMMAVIGLSFAGGHNRI